MVDAGSNVIDLGCGNGELLAQLQSQKKCKVTGVEISVDGVEICQTRGLNVMNARIDEPLSFAENQFDFAICNVTLQMVLYPEILLNEMRRISKHQIISFPNFAFYKNRLQLLFKGIMPSKMLFGYNWFNTGHIHQLSINDFRNFVAQQNGWQIVNEICVEEKSLLKNFLMKMFPNLVQQIPIFLLRNLK